MLPDTEIAWLAGIFDGEGSARIYRSNQRGKGGCLAYFSQVSPVCNTDPELLERVVRDLNELGLKSRYHHRRDTGNTKQPNAKIWWRACGSITLTSHDAAIAYLELISPCATGIKKAQALHVLSWLRIRKARGARNWGKGKPVELCDQDEQLYHSQPGGRGIPQTIKTFQ